MILAQDQRITFFCLENFVVIKYFETQENQKFYNNLKISIDSSFTYMAIYCSDKCVRIRKLKSDKVV